MGLLSKKLPGAHADACSQSEHICKCAQTHTGARRRARTHAHTGALFCTCLYVHVHVRPQCELIRCTKVGSPLLHPHAQIPTMNDQWAEVMDDWAARFYMVRLEALQTCTGSCTCAQSMSRFILSSSKEYLKTSMKASLYPIHLLRPFIARRIQSVSWRLLMEATDKAGGYFTGIPSC